MQHAPQRTRRQRVIERQFSRPLADVIDDLLYGQNLTHERAASRLGVSYVTLWHWRRQLASESQSQPAPAAEEQASVA